MRAVDQLVPPSGIPTKVWNRFKDKIVVTSDGHWLWTHNLGDGKYATFSYQGESRSAHRLSYEWFKGYLPPYPEMTVDHLCELTRCVNPEHLALKTIGDNVRAGSRNNTKKQYCPRGHSYDKVNSQGRRICTGCSRVITLRSQHKKKPNRCKEGCECKSF